MGAESSDGQTVGVAWWRSCGPRDFVSTKAHEGLRADYRPTTWPASRRGLANHYLSRHFRLRRWLKAGTIHSLPVRKKSIFCSYVRVVCTGRPFMSLVMLYPFNW